MNGTLKVFYLNLKKQLKRLAENERYKKCIKCIIFLDSIITEKRFKIKRNFIKNKKIF